jgi:uncharacterized protein (UPF0332 family)
VITLISESDCFEKGLLKRTFKQPDLARKDVAQAKFFLEETKDLVELEKKHMATLSLYNAFFHAARALLFRDGIKERSHYCVARYIEKEYDLDEFVHAFETMMNLRHNVQYATEKVEIEIDFVEFVALAHKFIIKIEELL